jgi:GTP-binding protein EngB required for normal cell division
MDKVTDRDSRLDAVADRFGMIPPWKQWRDVIAPVSAKQEQVSALKTAIRDHLHEQSRDDLLQFF